MAVQVRKADFSKRQKSHLHNAVIYFLTPNELLHLERKKKAFSVDKLYDHNSIQSVFDGHSRPPKLVHDGLTFGPGARCHHLTI